MSLSPAQLEELGRSVLGDKGVDKAKETKEDAMNIYNHYQRLSGAMSGVSPMINKNSINKFTGISAGQTFSNPLKASISEMPLQARQRAELVKTSSVLQQQGLEAATKRMAINSPNYEFLPTASTPDYIAVRNKMSGKIEIAFRGTDPTAKITSGYGKGLLEPVMWPSILATGNEGKIFDQHKLEDIIKSLRRAGVKPSDIEHISGYSMGGTKAHRLGDMLGVETTLLNPFVGKNFFSKPTHPNVKHKIYRTTEDIASAQGFVRNKIPSNVTVDSIDPVAVLSEKTKGVKGIAEDIVALHDLDHFVVEGNRNSEVRTAQEAMDARVEKYNQERAGLPKERQKILQDEMLSDIEPHMKVLGNQVKKFKARTGFMKGTIKLGRTLGSAGGGFAASQEVDAILSEMGIQDPYIHAGAAGAAAGAADVGIMRALGGAASLANLRSAVFSGGMSALLQEGTSQGLNAALLAAGVDPDTAGVISQGTGGAVGGGSSVAIPMAIKRAGSMMAQNASRMAAIGETGTELTPLLEEGLAEAALETTGETILETGAEAALEVAGEAAAEAAAEATAEVALEAAGEAALEATLGGVAGTFWWSPVGWIAGAALLGTLISGGVRIAEIATRPGQPVILHPTRNPDVDNAIKENEEIKKLIQDFNNSQDRSQEALTKLSQDVEAAASRDPRVPANYGYRAHILAATEENKDDIVNEFDYSSIPDRVRNMNAEEYYKAQGDAKLHKDHFYEYTYLNEEQKLKVISDVEAKYGSDFKSNLDNNTTNYLLAAALEADKDHITKSYRDSVIVPLFREQRRLHEQQEAIQKGLDEYNKGAGLISRIHQKYSEFLRTDPRVKEFVNNGDINGLNKFLHDSIRDPNIAGNIYHSLLTSDNRIQLRNAIQTNLPQLDASGNVSYITTGDKPLQIDAETERRLMGEAHSLKLSNMYKSQQPKLEDHPIGNALLQTDKIKDMINKGALPEDINKEIDTYYKTHPLFRQAVDSRRVSVPKFEPDGSIKYSVTQRPSEMTNDEHRDFHIKRKQAIHTPKPLDLGITPLMTPTSKVEPAVPSAAQ